MERPLVDGGELAVGATMSPGPELLEEVLEAEGLAVPYLVEGRAPAKGASPYDVAHLVAEDDSRALVGAVAVLEHEQRGRRGEGGDGPARRGERTGERLLE